MNDKTDLDPKSPQEMRAYAQDNWNLMNDQIAQMEKLPLPETHDEELRIVGELKFIEGRRSVFANMLEEPEDLPGAPCYLCGDVEGEVKPDCDAAGEDLEPGASCPVCSGEELEDV